MRELTVVLDEHADDGSDKNCLSSPNRQAPGFSCLIREIEYCVSSHPCVHVPVGSGPEVNVSLAHFGFGHFS